MPLKHCTHGDLHGLKFSLLGKQTGFHNYIVADNLLTTSQFFC